MISSTASACAAAKPAMAEVPSEIESSEIPEPTLSFPEGILGFPSCRRFLLEPAEADGFYWLQSMECESLAFLLVDPFRAVDGYSVDLTDTDLHHLQTCHAPDLGVMAIVTLPRRAGDPPTANLQGVVAFNFAKRIGRQVITQNSPYNTRWPLDLGRMRLAS